MGFAMEYLRNPAKPPATGKDELLNTRLILAAEKSACTGMPVAINA